MRPSVAVLGALGLVACGVNPLPRREPPIFPTLSDAYNTRILSLRTTLGRGGIGLRIGGFSKTFSTSDCDGTTTGTFSGCARCDLADQTTRLDGAVLEAMTRAFARYPADVLSAANVKDLAVCTEIVHAKARIEHPAGLADVRAGVLLLSVKSFVDDADYASRLAWTVDNIAHHEIFHHLEYAQMRSDMFDDPEWNLYNPLGFEYSTSHESEERRAGFVNSYAMTDAVEDKASVYEMLMAHPDELCELARTDETIRMKTKIIWRRVWRAIGTDSFMREAAPCVDWHD